MSSIFLFRLFGISSLFLALCICGPQHGTVAAFTSQSAVVNGTWSGMFLSKNPRRSPFTMTVVISSGIDGELLGTASAAAECFSDAVLHVKVESSKVVLAGSDENGSSITFKGELDGSGTQMNLHYIVRGSGSKCESDVGTGSIGKR